MITVSVIPERGLNTPRSFSRLEASVHHAVVEGPSRPPVAYAQLGAEEDQDGAAVIYRSRQNIAAKQFDRPCKAAATERWFTAIAAPASDVWLTVGKGVERPVSPSGRQDSTAPESAKSGRPMGTGARNGGTPKL